LYFQGRGVSQNYTKALERFTRACDLGDNYGCAFLGIMHDEGKGVGQNISKAVKFYTKACDAGIKKACINLANLYDIDQSVK